MIRGAPLVTVKKLHEKITREERRGVCSTAKRGEMKIKKNIQYTIGDR